MKKLFLTIILVLSLSGSAFATDYYVDYANGDDANAGDDWGAANAWKTIEGHSATVSAGDRFKIAKSAEVNLSDTCDWTDGSATVSTDSDETGNVSAGDFIKATSDTIWWEVSSITSTTITLTTEYYGDAGADETTEKVTPFQTSGDGKFDLDVGGSDGNELIISGGWDTGTDTQDGISFYDGESNSGTGMADGNNSFIEVEKIIFARYNAGLYLSHYEAHCWTFTDCQFIGNSGNNFSYEKYGMYIFNNLKVIDNNLSILADTGGEIYFEGHTEFYGGKLHLDDGGPAYILVENITSDSGIQVDEALLYVRKGDINQWQTEGNCFIYASNVKVSQAIQHWGSPEFYRIYEVNRNQIAYNHKIYIGRDGYGPGIMISTGSGLTDSTIKTAGNHGIRFAPYFASFPLKIEIPIPVENGTQVTVDGYLRMNSTYQSDTDKTTPYIKLSGCGITETTDTMTDTSGSWESVSVSGTPTRDGSAILTIVTAANDSGAYAYADEFTVTDGASNTDGTFNFWSELSGQPSGLTAGGGGEHSYGFAN
jgi:hypothetical protein